MKYLVQKQYHLDFPEGRQEEKDVLFDQFILDKQKEFMEQHPEIKPDGLLVSRFAREEWGKVLFLESPFDRPYPIARAPVRPIRSLKSNRVEKITGSKSLGHFAGLVLKAQTWESPDGASVRFRNHLKEGKFLGEIAPKVDYLELSLYEMLPLYIHALLEVLQDRKIANLSLDLIDISFDLVGTSLYHVKRVAEMCLDDLIIKRE